MIQKAKKSSHHPEFGEFLLRELSALNIERADFRDACHMKQTYLEDIKKGSTITR